MSAITNSCPFILYLPDVAIEKIFSFLTFDERARNRIVCRKFNEVGSKMLSRGFIQLERRHAVIYKRVKQALPRRESERRTHPLARHNDILQAIETRISMLNMTYTKYIELKLCCFIPGKVLDEMRHVLNMVESHQTPPRTHQVLQELRDLSSMAIEHFDEHILPRVKEQLEMKTGSPENKLKELEVVAGSLRPFSRFQDVLCQNVASSSKTTKILLHQQVQQVLSSELLKVKKQGKNHKHYIMHLTQSNNRLYLKMRKQSHRLTLQSAKIREQERKLQEQNAKIAEQESALSEIKKHIDEWDQKYKDLTTELIRARDEILLKTTTHTPVTPPIISDSCVTPSNKTYKSNIKPRSAHILPKNYLQMDLDRKRKSNLLPEIPLKRSKSPSPILKHPTNIKSPSKTPRDKLDLIQLNIPDPPSLIYTTPTSSNSGSYTTNSSKVGMYADRHAHESPASDDSGGGNLRKRALLFDNGDLGSLIVNSIENLMTPLAGLSKRRKDDIDLK